VSKSKPLETLPETPPSSNPISRSSANIVQRVNRNLGFQSKWAELNGAMGDLGTYIPIVLALTLAKNLNLGTTLIFTGIYSRHCTDFNIPEIMASRSCTGAILLVLGVTGLMQMMYKFIPLSVVRNQSEEAIVDEERNVRRKRMRKIMVTIPSAFIIFLLVVVLAFIRRPKVVNDIKFGPSVMDIVKITGHSWKEGFIKGTIPQLPLSVLNSVIAVCKLSSDLFPGKEFSATSVSVTVGLLNLVRCWFGAMPCCHGAGGLARQYNLGAAKMMLGLVLGTSLVTILHQFPVGILGVLLLFEGTELAMTCRDMNSKQESIVMLICTAVSLVGSSAALGFVCGMLVHVDTLWVNVP
ncbi:hypothetical protein V6Z11_D06G054900, partial [Gossypium hirsutum]